MTPGERWHRIQQLTEQLEPLSPEQRITTLDQIETDPAIRQEVLLLLDALAAESSSTPQPQPPQAPPLPPTIGPYQILSCLGQGGTSTVYKAQQILDPNAPPRQVAIKVLNAYLATASRIERFEREFEILSRLDHPNICRVLDSGITPEQQPYLVLELLDATPIDVYADQHRLTIQQRIELAIVAADTMVYAHRNFIAHLDLKPSNILVTSTGRVKILDFGTAKILEPFDNLTTTRYLTPLYASPEQLRGDPISTSCDIYSLGLIVFELLAGATPFSSTSMVGIAERASGATTARRLTEIATAQAASSRGLTLNRLKQQLTGDLEIILARTLELEPDRRYPSMAEFAGDLRRFLSQRPILARPQTLSYRISKFVRRNRAAVAFASLAFLATSLSTTFALLEQRHALAEGRRAQQLGDFLTWLLYSSNPQYGGRQGATVLDMMRRADSLLQQQNFDDPRVRIAIETMVANMFIEGGGDAARGLQILEASLQRARASNDRDSILAISPPLANAYLNQGNCPAVLSLVSDTERMLRDRGNNASANSFIAPAVMIDSFRFMCTGKSSGDWIRAAINRLPEFPDTGLSNGLPNSLVKALVYNAHANLLVSSQQPAEALAAIDLCLRYAAMDPNGRNIRVAALQTRGRIEYLQKNIAASANSYLEAATLAQNSATPFESMRLKVQAGQRLAEAGRRDEARALADQAVQQSQNQAAQLGDKRWMILIDAGITYSRLDLCQPAYQLFEEADQITRGNMPPAWKGNRYGFEAFCLATEGKPDQARQAAQKALNAAGAAWPPQSAVRKKMLSLAAANTKQ